MHVIGVTSWLGYDISLDYLTFHVCVAVAVAVAYV